MLHFYVICAIMRGYGAKSLRDEILCLTVFANPQGSLGEIS